MSLSLSLFFFFFFATRGRRGRAWRPKLQSQSLACSSRYRRWSRQLPGPGGELRALAFFGGAALTPRRLSRHRNSSIRGSTVAAAVVAADGLHSFSAMAPRRGQTVCSKSEASTVWHNEPKQTNKQTNKQTSKQAKKQNKGYGEREQVQQRRSDTDAPSLTSPHISPWPPRISFSKTRRKQREGTQDRTATESKS